MGGLLRHRLPLDAGRERRPAAPHQPGVLELADHVPRSDLDRPPERLVPAARAVVVQAPRVDDADPAEQPELGVALLGHAGRRRRGDGLGLQRADRVLDGDPGDRVLGRVLAGQRQHRGRRPIALAEARAAQPRAAADVGVLGPDPLLERGDQLLRAVAAAHDVVAYVQHPRRPRVHRQQPVERGDPVRVGRRHREALADVAERTLADPADPRLHVFEDRQQQVALLASLVAAVHRRALRRSRWERGRCATRSHRPGTCRPPPARPPSGAASSSRRSIRRAPERAGGRRSSAVRDRRSSGRRRRRSRRRRHARPSPRRARPAASRPGSPSP